MTNVVHEQRTANSSRIRPTLRTLLEEEAVDDQLSASLEKVHESLDPFQIPEQVFLLDAEPWMPPTFRGNGVTFPGE